MNLDWNLFNMSQRVYQNKRGQERMMKHKRKKIYSNLVSSIIFYITCKSADAFIPSTSPIIFQLSSLLSSSSFRIQTKKSPIQLNLIDPSVSPNEGIVLMDYAPAAAALFNNMKTPASILSAGMVSLGFLAPFRLSDSIKKEPKLLRRIELLKRAYVLVTLISFCSELLTVMWATVAVNQLTETVVAPTSSVWALLERDFDLSWSATNSHFTAGMYMGVECFNFLYMCMDIVLNLDFLYYSTRHDWIYVDGRTARICDAFGRRSISGFNDSSTMWGLISNVFDGERRE